ncbi:hypothetical protein HPP92_026330 [Vanilla planifolia]|uniref:Nuclear pore complex protein NUP1 n=2 Tax=Vanilla planifolia TaxID=51239 RepID=A0A835PDG2_VANPL|nr:hypothetical protein HPP92_026330 [Vanilla planifolia]
MATAERVGGTGGKLRKRPLRGAPSTPYDRPPEAARGIRGALPAAETGGRGWLSKLVDPASRLIARGALRLFSSVFQKRLTGPPEPPGQSLNATDEVPKVELTSEVKENNVNAIDTRDQLNIGGNERPEQETKLNVDGLYELERLVTQKMFTRKVVFLQIVVHDFQSNAFINGRSETERLTELLHARTVESSTLPSADNKNKGKVNEESNIDPTSSQPAGNHNEAVNTNATELEGSRLKMVRLGGDINSGVNVTIPEGDAISPIEVSKAYMGSKNLMEVPSTLSLSSQMIYGDTENYYKTPKLHGRSALYKMSRLPYCRSQMGYSPYKESSYNGPTRSFEATPLSNAINSGYRQAQKRSSLDRDEGLFSHARRVRQKSSLKDVHLPTCAGTSSSDFGRKYSADLEGFTDVGRIPLASAIAVPPRSSEMARKILHQLDKLVPSPINKSSEKKAIVGDASSSKSPINASLGEALTVSGNDGAEHCVRIMGSNSNVIGGFSTQKESTSQSAESDKVEHKVGEHAIFTLKSEPPREESLTYSSESVPISLIRGEAHVKNSSNKLAEFDASCTPKTLSCEPHLPPNDLSMLSKGASSKEGNVVTAFKVDSKSTVEDVSKPTITGIVQSTTIQEAVVSCTTSQSSELGRGGGMISTGPSNTLTSAMPVFPSVSFQFDSAKLSGVSSASSSKYGNSTFLPTSLNPILGGNRLFSFNASSVSGGSSIPFASKTSQNTAGISTTTITSSIASQAASTVNMVSSLPQNSVTQLGSLDSHASSGLGHGSLSASSSSQFGSAFSVANSIGLSSSFSFSAGSTTSLSMASSTTTNFPLSFSSAQPSSSISTLDTAFPSTSFSFGMRANASSSMPFLSSAGSSFPFVSAGKNITSDSPSPAQSLDLPTSATGFGSEFHPNDQMDTEDSIVDDGLKAAPMAQTIHQTTTSSTPFMSSIPSAAGAQIFNFGAHQNNSSPFQASGTVGFSAGGSFSLGSGGGEKSERKFIRVKRERSRRN